MEILLLKKISQLKSRVDEFTPLPLFGNHITHNYGNTTNSVCRGDDIRLTDSRPPTPHSHINAELPSNLVTTSLQINTGGGLVGGGNLSGDLTIAHADTSSQTSVIPVQPNEVIKSIQLDTYGHVVAITTGIVSILNNYLTAVTGSGNVSLNFARDGLSDLVVNMAHTHPWNQITGTPVTLSGYNISNAYTKVEIDQKLLEIPSGMRIKDPVLVATTGNITLSGTQTIDGVDVVAGNRVLVKDQISTVTNGVYIVASGAWTRAIDLDESSEIVHGFFYYVSSGTLNEATGWMLDLPTGTTSVMGTTPITFKQFFSSEKYSAGTGITKTANTFSVDFNSVAARVHTHAVTDIISGALPVSSGGTGVSTFTTGNVLIGAGTTPITTLSRSGIDTRTQFPPSNHNHSADDLNIGTLSVPRGGTGLSTLTSNSVLVGNGTGAVTLVSRSGIDTRTEFPAINHNHAGEQITTGTIAEARLPLTSDRLRKITISTSNPTGGANGDIWFKVY